jgi:ribonuclease III
MNKNEDSLFNFEKKIGIKFNDINLLRRALTHTSYSAEHSLENKNLSELELKQNICLDNNERLEFLGDAVLSMVISSYLYNKYPFWREGDLTKYRAKLISRDTCYNLAKQIGIGEFLFLGVGEEKTGGRDKFSNLANVFEALLGAIYLDKGLEVSTNFLIDYLEKLELNDFFCEDYKSQLQEKIQKKYKVAPTYEIVEEKGPAHNKIFVVIVKIDNKILGTGVGNNKKQAQQFAAKDALGQNTNIIGD